MKNKTIFGIVLFLIVLSSLVSADITREEAVNSINEAKQEIEEVVDQNISTDSLNALLLEAENALERADLSASLDNSDIDEATKEAIDYAGYLYEDVLIYTNEIGEKKNQIYIIIDSIFVLELEIEEYKNEGIDITETETRLSEIKVEFEQEHYTAAEEILEEAHFKLEEAKLETTSINIITNASKTFFEKYWYEILIILIIIIVVLYFIGKRIKISKIKSRINKLKAEEKSLKELIKKTQRERYSKKGLPASIYELRIKKYKEKINEIQHTLPVLKAKLRKNKKKAKKKKVKKKKR